MSALAALPSLGIGATLEEFLADSDVGIEWALQGVAVEGGLIAVLGRPESFKTQGLMSLGLAAAGGASRWMDVELGPPRPFVYVSNEKARSTVREKLRRISAVLPPTEPVHIVHRAGVTFGNRERWAEVVRLVASLGPRSLVGLDTLASLAGVGFDENRGQDMGVAIAAARQLCDVGATTFLLHHPAKHGDGTGGIRLRGHD